jgi:hypothetical protein
MRRHPGTFTQHEDMTEAALVVSSLGDPGNPDISVLLNHTGARVRGYVTLTNIAACARPPRLLSADSCRA